MTDSELDERIPRRRDDKGENRLPPAIAVIVAAAIYAFLPGSLLFLPRFVVPAVEAALLVALLVANPRRMVRATRWSRVVSAVLAVVILVANLVSLGLLISVLGSDSTKGGPLLIGAMQVWVTGVIGFGLLYWELDRGGPVTRRMAPRKDIPAADWRFSHDENRDNVIEVAKSSSIEAGWVPTFIDYMYMSLTNSSAFSPTDTMPLTNRAKILMGTQATAALLTTLLVIARAIGSFGGG